MGRVSERLFRIAGPAGGRTAVAAATATEEAPAAAVQAEGSLSGASSGRR